MDAYRPIGHAFHGLPSLISLKQNCPRWIGAMATQAKWRPYLQRAGEIAAHQPVVAHFCRLHAIELMMKARQSGNTSPELEKQLLGELGEAEAAKKTLNIASAQGQSTTESFALRVFDGADAADHAARDRESQAAVFQKFYAAALFLDVCAQFYDGELPPDLAEKARYARFRVVQIREGLKQGVPSYPEAPSADASASAEAPAAAALGASSLAPQLPPAAISAASPAVISSTTHTAPTTSQREEARKQTEMASSALDFGDVATARKSLLEALRVLG